MSGVVLRLVADISYTSMWDELGISDGVLSCEVLSEVAIGQGWRETPHENAG